MTEFSPAEKHEQVAGAASKALIQGSIIAFADQVRLVDPALPLTRASAEAELYDDDYVTTPIVEEGPNGWSMVISQTCDLARTGRNKYLAQICPVVAVAKSVDGMQIKGAMPQFVHVTWHSEVAPKDRGWVADLSRITTVERSVLVGATEHGRPGENLRRTVGERIARQFDRPAIPDGVVERFKPLEDEARRRSGKQSPTGFVIDQIDQIRIASEPPYDEPSPFALTIYFVARKSLVDAAEPHVVHPKNAGGISIQALGVALKAHQNDVSNGPLPIEIWAAAIAELLTLVTVEPPVGSVIGIIASALTPDEYANSDLLDLSFLTRPLNT